MQRVVRGEGGLQEGGEGADLGDCGGGAGEEVAEAGYELHAGVEEEAALVEGRFAPRGE